MPANTVEIRLKLRDQISAAYKRVKAAVGSSNRQLESSMGKVADANRRVESAFNRTAKAADRAKTSSLGLKAVYFGIAAFLTGRFVKAITKAGSEVEDLTVQFTVLEGSVEKAKARVTELEKFAQTTPFQMGTLGDATKLMLAFGVETEKVMPYLRQLGDIALGDDERLHRLALAFSQVQSAGRLMGQDLLQLINAGFNPLQEISKKTGESMLQLKKRMEEGKISAAEVAATFTDATSEGGRFYKGMEQMSKTVSGLGTTIRDQLNAVIRQILGAGLWDKLKDSMAGVVVKLKEAIDSGVFTRWGQRLISLSEHFGTIIRIGTIFFTVFSVQKITAIVTTFSLFLTKLVAANPVLAAIVASFTALELIFDRMDAKTADMAKGITDFTPDIKTTERLIYALETLQARQDALKSSTPATGWVRRKEVAQAIKDVEALTSKHYAKQLKDGEISVQKMIDLARMRQRALEQPIVTPSGPKKTLGTQAPPTLPDIDKDAIKRAEQAAQFMQDINIEALQAVAGERAAEIQRLQDWYDEKEAMLIAANESTELLQAVHNERLDAINEKFRKIDADKEKLRIAKAQQLAQKELQITQQKEDLKIQMAKQGIEAAQSLFGESKAAFLLLKGLAAAEIFINTQRASMAALAPPPLGLGPVLGGPLAGTIQAAGGISMAAVAAQAVAGFKDGGIVRGDQLIRVGEGGTSEAIIPLKNGAVPVRIEGQAQGSVVHNHYYMGGKDASGYGETSQERLKRFAETRRETDRLLVTG